MSNIEEMAEEINELRDILRSLIEFSPYPDFEDTDGSCYYCGSKNDHNSLCVYRRAMEVVNE